MELPKLRQDIDNIDTKLVNLLNERARISLNIGKAKKEAITINPEDEEKETHVYIPGREKQVFEKLQRLNYGPLASESLCAIYREIMSASISLQKAISISYFGPEGSNTHQAARERFGESVQYLPKLSIPDVFDAVEHGHSTYGIIPFENSTFGSVVTTLDRFISSKVQIRAETYLQISSLKRVYSHPQAFGQCQKWLDHNLKTVERVEAGSTSQAAQLAAAEPNAAAIANIGCAQLYGLNILERNIEDSQNNITRFFVIGTSSDAPTIEDKTFILFTLDHRQSGALCDALKVFKDYDINLTKIDTRPSLMRPWHYVFFIEFQGHKEQEEVKKALNELNQYCLDVVILGSYPNQKPVSLS
ncbi:6381_t:CDS:2 [Ambispora gerdemannii]|uniref:Bifunctional chorismate mutase/prephenate dehydratase n=1 Tax=Ambispora gerdemannii TaxID=144530 RepID=A0A9N8UZ84_9GLOM|nr:6381_t:CDS:2 [Ambispora gerdemannii]